MRNERWRIAALGLWAFLNLVLFTVCLIFSRGPDVSTAPERSVS